MSFYRLFAVGVVSLLSSMTGLTFADTPAPTGEYWFDWQNERHSFTPGKFEIDVNHLYEGFHTLSIMIENEGVPTAVASRFFIKSSLVSPNESHTARVYVDGKLYHSSDIVADASGLLHLEMDLTAVSLGIHLLRAEVVSKSGMVIGVGESCFLRAPTTEENNSYRLYYLIDNVPAGDMDAARIGNGWHFVPDVSDLSSGLHSLTAYLANPYGMATSASTAWFVKIPEGGEGVKSYDFWLNDNSSTLRHFDLPSVSDPYSLVGLLDMQQEPLCSSRYTFAIDDDGPAVYARNDFHIIFYDADYRASMKSGSFTDTRVKEAIKEIKHLEANTSTRISSVKDNEIRWYSFNVEMGDSISLCLNRAAMYELYSPSAKMLINRSGADALALSSQSLTENGTYYLAVHDVSGYYKDVDVTFNHIPRFAILNDGTIEAADGSMLIFDMVGNGFKALKSLSLTNGSINIEANDFYANDNYHASVHFDLPKGSDVYGTYDIVGVFHDEENGTGETATCIGAVKIGEYIPGEIEVTVDHPLRVSVPDEVYIRITNTSNRGCWGVPVNYAFQKPAAEFAISYKDFYPLSYNDPDGKIPLYYSTDDLLGTGEAGYFFPVHIPYIGPNETLTLSFGLRYDPAEILTMYAWAGQPWSEEFEEILSDGFDFNEIINLQPTNILSARALCHLYLKMISDKRPSAATGAVYAPSFEDIRSVAEDVNNVYGAVARTEAGIINGLRLRGANATLAACGIDPSDPDNPLSDYTQKLKNGMPTPGSIIAQALGEEDIYNAYQAYREYNQNCPREPNPRPRLTSIQGYRSWDPNEIIGYTSPGGTNHIGINVKTINYMIEFENDPETANAAAHTVKVTDILDKDIFDLSTLKMQAVDIGGKILELDGESHFVKTLDLRPEINVIAQISLDYDQTSGVANWNMISLDPMTLEPTLDVMQGILPVNHHGDGIGQIFFSIDLRDGLSDGMRISNEAEIIFDDNPAIVTDAWVNILDYVRPEASILNVSTDDNLTFDFEVEGFDHGSGIWMYDLYVRTADSSDWTLVRTQIPDYRFSYISPEAIEGADFAVIAIDKAGNRQDESFFRALVGDADGNGYVDANDVLIIRNYYMKVPTQINLKNADATRDGEIDAQDALSTRNIYLDPTAKAESNKLRTRKK